MDLFRGADKSLDRPGRKQATARRFWFSYILFIIIIGGILVLFIYRLSQEECARLWEGVPYVKVYRYNPKHLCPKLNGNGDNGQRKVWSSGGSTHCTCQRTILSMSVLECGFILWQFISRPLNCLCTSFLVIRWYSQCLAFMSCIVLGTLRTTMTWVRVFL